MCLFRKINSSPQEHPPGCTFVVRNAACVACCVVGQPTWFPAVLWNKLSCKRKREGVLSHPAWVMLAMTSPS